MMSEKLASNECRNVKEGMIVQPKTLAKFSFFSAFVLLALCIFAYFDGLYYNDTASMPLGLYKEVKNSKLQKDDLVILVVPQKTEPLLKKIVALSGDLVEVNRTGVYINNVLMPNSTIFKFDSEGNPLEFKSFKGILKQDEIFVMGDHVRSYDSRYFNIINTHKNQVRKVRAVITF